MLFSFCVWLLLYVIMFLGFTHDPTWTVLHDFLRLNEPQHFGGTSVNKIVTVQPERATEASPSPALAQDLDFPG